MLAIETVVDKNKNLIGFIFSGKAAEFGIEGNGSYKKALTIEQLRRARFANTQMKFEENGRMRTAESFIINELPMNMEVNGKVTKVNGMIAVTKKYVREGETVGFEVVYPDNSRANIRLSDLAVRCNYFKPYNFCIKHTSEGRLFVASKAGFTSMADIPTINVVDNKERKAVGNMKPVSDLKPLKEYKEINNKKMDVLDLYEVCIGTGSILIKLPGEKYKIADGGTKYTYGEGFTPYGDAEIAYPYPVYADNKMNVSLTFRKPGYAVSSETGKKYECYTNINKCIFEDGENKFKTIGIAIPKNRVQRFMNCIQGKVAFSKVSEIKEDTMKTLNMLMEVDKYDIIVVDTQGIGLLTDDKVKSSILSTEQIKELCLRQFEIRLLNKYVGPRGEVVKSGKKLLGNEEYGKLIGNKLYYKYAKMSNSELSDIKKAGINIFTGAFDVYSTKEKSGSSDGKGKDSIYVQYVYKNFDYTKITAKQLVQYARTNDQSVVTEYTTKLIGYIDNIEDTRKQVIKALELYGRISENLEDINKTLWKHRSAMLIQGRGKYIHTHDADDWKPDANSRAKNYNVYINTKSDGLRVRFTGVAI